jgi:hypothetical protein
MTWDSLKDYWTVTEQFLKWFYSKTMTCDRFLHILQYLHFSNNHNGINNSDQNYDRIWKITFIFDVLNVYSKNYASSEHLIVDEVIVLFKQRVSFKE